MKRFAKRRPLLRNMVPYEHIDSLWKLGRSERPHRSGLSQGGRILQKLVAGHTSEEPVHVLAKAALHGDPTALGALHDHLDEHKHPLNQLDWRGLMNAVLDEKKVTPYYWQGTLFKSDGILFKKPRARERLDRRLEEKQFADNRTKGNGVEKNSRRPTLFSKEPYEMRSEEYFTHHTPFLPALLFDGEELVIGKPGQAHYEIQKPEGKWWERAISNGWADRGGKFYTNSQAAKLIGDKLGIPKEKQSIWTGHSGTVKAILRDRHLVAIKQALKSGKTVPQEVINDYWEHFPQLQTKIQTGTNNPEQKGRGQPDRNARKLYRVKSAVMNPLILGSRLGAILNEYQHQNPQDEASQIANHALNNSDTRDGKLDPTGFGVLADYMLEHEEHPLAKAFDWRGMMRKLQLDEDLHKAINFQITHDSTNKGYLSTGYDDPKLFDIVNMGSGGAKKSYRTDKFNHLFKHFKERHSWIEEQDLVNSAARVYDIRNRLTRMRQINDMREQNDPYLPGILDRWRGEKKEQQTIPPEGHHERFSRGKPTRLQSFQSPAGGLVARGTFYQGGKMLPKEATQTAPRPESTGILASIVKRLKPKKKKVQKTL